MSEKKLYYLWLSVLLVPSAVDISTEILYIERTQHCIVLLQLKVKKIV